ncbi:nop14 [Holotrichia oblita]|uniref:Nop14 n=1 Tax=Holotrichia oblita TaxID=644536 RepID=A0ACB9T182_HOLOL|nr:nop14 [Holotrichia oblita]
MVGAKKKFNKSSERSHKQLPKKKLNPFEVHINREKLKVLGKKNKNDRGLPGVSREKALKKRKHTLQQEFKLNNKANRFVDKRIGEGDINMTEEDRFIARYAKLKAKHHKKSIFNLADEEVLTHKGQALSEIEKFEDAKSDDDDDGASLEGDKIGNLDEKFVDEAHFGGGVLKRTGIDGAKSHKDLIDQLIAESKKRKAEKQKLKEETLELTEKLDSDWKDLLPLVNKTKSSKATAEIEKADEYDKTVKQLKFEARGTPSDRLKSEDEIAKEEREKLEELEKERVQRMRGITTENDRKPKHFSADDLDDNFAYESDPEVTLSYNQEGVANLLLEAELDGKIIFPKGEEEEEEDEESDNDVSESSEEENEAEDDLSDLKGSESVSESDNEYFPTNTDDKINPDTIRDDLLKRKEIMEKAREELPYTYKFPSNYEELQLLLKLESSERQFIMLERLIKCNHPSLGNQNKENLNLLFAYLLQYINDISK